MEPFHFIPKPKTPLDAQDKVGRELPDEGINYPRVYIFIEANA
jgi:hypothetical protein